MMQKTIIRGQALLSAAILALALAGPVCDRALAVDGNQQRTNVNELTHQLTWFDNMNQALACARQRGKPLVWIHMLGKIDGAT
jgi:hypothetical protein